MLSPAASNCPDITFVLSTVFQGHVAPSPRWIRVSKSTAKGSATVLEARATAHAQIAKPPGNNGLEILIDSPF